MKRGVTAAARVHAPGPGGEPSVAIQSLLQPLFPRAYAAARCLTGSAAEAENLLQETALLARQEFGTFQAGTNFQVWFLRILMNSYPLASTARPSGPVSVDDAPDPYLRRKTSATRGRHTDPAQACMEKLDTEQVVAALASLPDEYRVVVTLYFLEDLSYRDIATIVDWPVETVRTRLHRGRRLLQVALSAEAHGLSRQN